MVGTSPGGENSAHLWLPPTRIVEGCTSTAGYPDGRHHALVKAAEARLAFQMGAVEIALMPNPDSPTDDAVLAEAVAVREALPHPARLLLFVDPRRHNLEYLAASGVDGFVIPGWGKCESPIPLVRIVQEDDAHSGSVVRETAEGYSETQAVAEAGAWGSAEAGTQAGALLGEEVVTGGQPRHERLVYLRQQ